MLEIRAAALPQVELARLYGVSTYAIYAIKHRLTWIHL